MLPSDRLFLNSVVNSAGGDSVKESLMLLRYGGIIPSTRCQPDFYQAFLLGPYSYLYGTISKN